MSVEPTFGQWLKQRRRQLDLTQNELAQQVGCSVATIRKIEQDARRPSKQLAELMATELKIPPAQQSAFIAFARTETYMAPIPDGLTIIEDTVAQPPPLPETITAVSRHTSAPAPNNLPPPATPFIGRETELASLRQYIVDPATRLVTIVGVGGMGKTRLALACAERQLMLGHFTNGIFFVNLAPLRETGQIVSALAQALDYEWIVGDGRSPQHQLLDYLCQKEMLLLFDNFEHLLDGVNLLTEILQTAPKVQILVTSRERLYLQMEQVYPIEGLEFPDWETPEDAEAYTAVQLFLQSAQRNQPDFALRDGDDLTYLAHICRTVAGMPLALELAASWVDILPLADIAAELQQGLDLLEADRQDMPERHRSVRAAIDYSWHKLDKKESDIFAGLSVFRGGFTKEAAQTVVGANLRQLARLVSKSWLQGGGVKGDGRYQIHELLRQYGAEKLREGEQETAKYDAHSAYFCEALQIWDSELKGSRQQMALSQIAADEDNIRAAWNWAIVHEKWGQIDQAVNGLARFYLECNHWFEGESVCRQAATKQEMVMPGAPAELATLTKTLTWHGNFILLLGQGETAEKILQRSLLLLENPILSDQDTRAVKAHAMWLMAILSVRKADFVVAKQWAEQSLALYEMLDDSWGSALLVSVIGTIQHKLGHKFESKQLLEKSLASFRMLGDQIKVSQHIFNLIDIAMSDGQLEEAKKLCLKLLATWKSPRGEHDKEYIFNILAWIALFQGKLTQAEAYFQKSLQKNDGKLNYWAPDSNVGQSIVKLHQEQYEQAANQVQLASNLIQDYGMQPYRGHIYLIQGCLAMTEGEDIEAQRFLEEAIAFYETLREQHFLVDALGILGMILVKLGRLSEAQRYLHKAIDLAIKIHSFKVPSPLVGVALFLAEIGQMERASELYALTLTDPLVANSRWFASIYGQAIARAETVLSPDVIKKASTRDQGLDWWPTAESLLAELENLQWHQSEQTITMLHNLPAQMTPFIGREKELESLNQFISERKTRLVTIVGAGGMGKTRLALACAERQLMTGQFTNGIFFVNLAPLSETGQIVSALADVLGYQLIGGDGRSPQQQLLDYLRRKEMLLLFDNFEHLLDGVELLNDILQVASKVQILVASRERLHLQTEQIYPIEGLEFPDWEASDDTADFTAVQLFLQSARRNQPDFVLRDSNDLTCMVSICRTVAGMPLALELAASWVDTLPLSEIATELQHGLDLLETDARDMPERHRSVRAAIDYSWQKLDQKEQDVFAGLSVFRGGFTRGAAQAVAGVSLRQLARFVSKSWLQGGGVRGDGRYQIHELLRQYGAEKLAANSKSEVNTRNQHSLYYCVRLGQLAPDLRGPRQQATLALIEADNDNVRVAWYWATQQKHWEQLDTAVNGLSRYYLLRGRYEEGAAACQQAAASLNVTLAQETAAAMPRILAQIWVWQANFAWILGDKATGVTLLQESLALLDGQSEQDQATQLAKAHALHVLGLFSDYYDADLETARQTMAQSLAIYQTLDDQWGEAWCLRYLGQTLQRLNFKEKARSYLEHSLTSFKTLGDKIETAMSLQFLGYMAIVEGQYQEAEQLGQESLIISEEIGIPFNKAQALNILAWKALPQGQLTQADSYFEKALAIAHDMSDVFNSYSAFIGQSCVQLHKGEYEQARALAQKAFTLRRSKHKLNRYYLSALGDVALALGEYDMARRYLQESVDLLTSGEQHFLIEARGVLGLTLLKLGYPEQARQQLFEALQLALHIRSYSINFLLAGIAVFLSEHGDGERAIALYALAESHPLIARSRWFADVYGRPVATVANTLRSDIVRQARARGKNLDMWQTATSLLAEFTELGWGEPGDLIDY